MSRDLNRLIYLLTLTSLLPICVQGLGTYIYNGVKCDYCPAGSFRRKHCTSSQRTQCETCPDGQYSPENRGTHCLRCPDKDCRKIHHTVVELNCTKTHPAVCVCKPGYWLRSKHDPACKPHWYCRAGEGVVAIGTPVANTECKPCDEGTFSNITSRTEPCIAHSICVRGVKIPGNQTADNVCADFESISEEMSTLAPATTESVKNSSSGNHTNATDGEPPTGKPVQILGTRDTIIICTIVGVLALLCSAGFGVFCWWRSHQDSSADSGKQYPNNNDPRTTRGVYFQCGTRNDDVLLQGAPNPDSPPEEAGNRGRRPYQRVNSRNKSSTEEDDVDLLPANPGPSGIQKKAHGMKRRSSKVSSLDSGTSVKVLVTQPSPSKLPVTIEDFFRRIGEDIKHWKKTVRALPGLKRMRDQNIDTIYQSCHHEGLDEVRYQCLQKWYMWNKTAELDVIQTIRKTLVKEDKAFYKKQGTLKYLDDVMIEEQC